MSDNVYIGRRCASVSKPPALKPISKVILWIDNERFYEAGDDTGREHEITCPYGTQEMADNLLRKLSGYKYQPVTVSDALLDPAAELGDPVTVDDCYTVMASLDLSFDGLLAGDISAPGAAELAPEYTLSSAEKILSRKIARANSRITKTEESIRLEVGGALGVDADGNLVPVASSIVAELGKLTLSASSADGSAKIVLEGGDVKVESKTFDLSVKSANIKGKLTIGQLPSNVATMEDIPDLSDLVTEDDIADFIKAADLGESGRVVIDGGRIAADSIFADALHLGGMLKVYSSEYGNGTGGYLGYDSGFSGSYGIGIRSANESQQVVCTNSAARMSSGDAQVICTGNYVQFDAPFMMQFYINGTTIADLTTTGLHPVGQYVSLGTPQYQWQDVHGAGTSLSDLLSRVEKLEEQLGG